MFCNSKLKAFEFHIMLPEKYLRQAVEIKGIILIKAPFSLLYSGIFRWVVKMCDELGKL